MPDSETGAGALQSCRFSREAGTTGQSAAWQTLVSGLQNGVAPALFMHSIDIASHQLGNRAFMHWVGALQAEGVDVADRDAAAHNDPPAAPLQLMPKKRKKTGTTETPEALQEEPPEIVAATLETPAEPGAGVGPEPEETSLQAGPEGAAVAKKKKKKKKSRVQVALNTLRADGVEAFQRYIEAEVGETGLLRDLTERINRAEDLENVRDAALGFVAARLRALDPQAGAATSQPAEKAVIASFRSVLNPREMEIFKCCMIGDVRKLRQRLNFGSVDINMAIPEATLLCYAAYHGHVAIVRELLSVPGINVNLAQHFGGTPLYLAAQRGHATVVDLLLSARGINPNLAVLVGATPLYIAAEKGHEAIVESLLKFQSIQVDACRDDGVTPLLMATQKGNPGVVELLLRADARVNVAFADGTAPLHVAVNNGDFDVAEVLLRSPEIRVNQRTETLVTALAVACRHGHKELVRLLLENGADPNMVNDVGIAPLHLVCLLGYTEIAEMLLNAGADQDVRMRTEEQFTPFQLTRLVGQKQIIVLLDKKRRQKVQRVHMEELSPCLRPQGQALQDQPEQAAPLPQAHEIATAEPAPLPESGVGGGPEPAGTEQTEAATAASPDTAPDSPPRSAKPQSPLERAKTEFIGTVLEKLRNDWLDPLDGIRLLEQVNTVADLDGLCVIFNRLAGIERKKFRSGRRQLWRGVPAAEAAPADAGPCGFALGDKPDLDADAVEDEIKRHLEQPYHRFVSQAVNDMEFGRGKPATGYPGLLHASAGIAGVGSCSVFFCADANTRVIRIVGIGHHLDRGTYRLDYAAAELRGLRTIRLS